MSVLLMLFCCTFALAEEEIVDLYIEMTVTMEDGVIYADLVDDRGGTVSTWPVSLEVDGVQVDTVTTDEYGVASFHYAIPENTQEIACIAKDGQYANYRFKHNRMSGSRRIGTFFHNKVRLYRDYFTLKHMSYAKPNNLRAKYTLNKLNIV